MARRQHIRETLDHFSYILLQGLDYPTTMGQTLDAVFTGLLSGIDVCIREARQEDSRRLLQIARQEAEQALKRYAAGDLHGGSDLLQQAEAHFEVGVSGKKIRATFVAGPTGIARNDS
jgi:hypothetical protein